MKLRLLYLVLTLPLLGLLTVARAEPEFLKDFPPLVISGQSETQAESFKSSATTKELYAKYYGFARMLKTGDMKKQKQVIKDNLARDLPYWKTEAARTYNPPKAPQTKDKKVLKAYETRVAKAEGLHAKKIAVAETYVNWLSVDIPAWLAKVE